VTDWSWRRHRLAPAAHRVRRFIVLGRIGDRWEVRAAHIRNYGRCLLLSADKLAQPAHVSPRDGTFGDCQVLLGHKPRTVTQKYMAAEITRLIEAAERALATEHRVSVPMTIIRRKVA
jgi:hypothetical protein